MSNKGRLPALGLGAEHLEQHTCLHAHLLYHHLSLSPSLPLSSLSLFKKGCPPLVSLVNPFHLFPLSLPPFNYQEQVIRPPWPALPHVVFPLVFTPSSPLQLSFLHLLPSSVLLVNVFI